VEVDMTRFSYILAGLVLALCLAAGAAQAESAAIRTMAGITMKLEHFPSDADKEKLTAIIDSDDSTEEEASIAMALVNLQHKVGEKDAERLADIVDDDMADPDARALAGILLGINHMASDADKQKLATIAGT
jgi:hypothetical protein